MAGLVLRIAPTVKSDFGELNGPVEPTAVQLPGAGKFQQCCLQLNGIAETNRTKISEVIKMVRGRLRRPQSLIAVFVLLVSAAIVFSTTTLSREPSLGLTLEWESIGSDVEINYVRTEGGRNERKVHTHISKRSPKSYALMPGDVDGIPKWMEVEWQYGIIEGKTYEEAHRFAKHAKAYIDMKSLIPPEYIAEVARDRHRKQLKLTGTFKDDKLSARADVYQWRD